MLTVAEIMTREPYTLGPDDTLAAARQLLAEHHIRHIPIVSAEGSLIGVVSQRDVLAAGDTTVLPREASGSRENYVALSTIMTTPVQTVDESASLRGTALHLQKHKVGCLPVLRKGKLVGIITDSDFVTIAINLMEQLEAQEPEEFDFDEEETL
ncbi:MAG: CBS domain-containing protein [Halioglobus sp.]|nr:CBS domain-containing protein [Halioglobus sp.]MCB1710321.1 CBS domain-containing protein [Halioglobus sp.]MCP5122478.1 CBS domain-containing protein [Pseudomonadales bacterium]MCP5191646.1 CBS domain-containing protein [Pseudomonadales bacterium]